MQAYEKLPPRLGEVMPSHLLREGPQVLFVHFIFFILSKKILKNAVNNFLKMLSTVDHQGEDIPAACPHCARRTASVLQASRADLEAQTARQTRTSYVQ